MAQYSKEMDDMAGELGYTFSGITGGGHRRYLHPKLSRPVFVGNTPSDYRAVRNNKSLLRRLLRSQE